MHEVCFLEVEAAQFADSQPEREECQDDRVVARLRFGVTARGIQHGLDRGHGRPGRVASLLGFEAADFDVPRHHAEHAAEFRHTAQGGEMAIDPGWGEMRRAKVFTEREHDFMCGRGGLAKQFRQRIGHREPGRDAERQREVEREVLEVVSVRSDGVLALAFVPGAENRFGRVTPARGDGERGGEAMREIGLDRSLHTPQRLTQELVNHVDLVVTIDGKDGPYVPTVKRMDWQVDDPQDQPLEKVRAIRDEIEAQVNRLVQDLGL